MSDFPKARIKELIKEIHNCRDLGVGDEYQSPVMATIHAIIAEEQAKTAERREIRTAK
jgi:hypothetical protein